jgi:hypothetical protein
LGGVLGWGWKWGLFMGYYNYNCESWGKEKGYGKIISLNEFFFIFWEEIY